MKANHPRQHQAKEATSSTKQVGENKHSKRVKVTSDNNQSQVTSTGNSNFSKTPWTNQSALDFLQRVNDTSSEGSKVVGEKVAEYSVNSNSGGFPGNSIFVLENNRSGAGDGGVLLTKNDDNTVTLTIGDGAGSAPIEKAVIDSKTYKVISENEIQNNDLKSMWQYFGIKEPGVNNYSDDDSSSDDSSNDNSSDNDSDNNDNSQSSDTNNDNSQSSDTNNDDSDN